MPRGLKALAYRLCGIHYLEEYKDIIKEADEKVAQEYLNKVIANKCVECTGEREVSVPFKRQSKKPDVAPKFKRVRCPTCGGDGTAWPKPRTQILQNDDGSEREYNPRSVGGRVREILKRGAGFKESWESVDVQVRNDVESRLGPLREATLKDVEPHSRVIDYAGKDADATLRVFNVLHPIVRDEGLLSLYELDRKVVSIIDRMQRNGILIDQEHFARINKQFTEEQNEIKEKLFSLVGRFNPASPKQVGAILYGQLNLRAPKRDAGTDEKTLENLKLKYQNNEKVCTFIANELEFRELDKLKGTYSEPIPKMVDGLGRLHTRFLLHVTTSGRLSSRDPNCQNIPARTDRGMLIRQGFIAKPGCKLVSIDLDQIELRVGAHLAEDENMIEIFKTGKDIHRATAALIYKKPLEEVTTRERYASKVTNFGIFYGMSPRRLQNELALNGIFYTLDECVDIINNWFKAYPGIRSYMDRCHHEARTRGYVECLFGRRRYLPGVHSPVDKLREESLRWSVNHPDQGTAAGILKLWMSRVHKNLPSLRRFGYVEPLLTVHDEIILEVEDGLENLVIGVVANEAANVMQLLVPIAAKGKAALNWSELK